MSEENNNEQNARELTKQFVCRVKDLEVEIYDITIREIQKNQYFNNQEKPGVYMFIQDGFVVYVGRALNSSRLGGRVWEQLRSTEHPDWAAIVQNGDVKLLLVTIPIEEDYWASSLETFLIGEMWPRFNLRR